MDCLFCKIAQGAIPATIHYEDTQIVAFADIYPKAPVHLLIIPRRHIATLNDLTPADVPLVGQMVQVATQLAKKLGLSDKGYRIVNNCNEEGGQTVFHIHCHLLGGRQMTWPPG